MSEQNNRPGTLNDPKMQERLLLDEALKQKKLRKDWLIDPSCQFYQSPEHFCSNTDTALLAQFVKIPAGSKVLEIGCNNGALLCYLDRFSPALLCGAEILKDPARLAAFNCRQFLSHPWIIFNEDIRKMAALKTTESRESRICACSDTELQNIPDSFDVICSNPPFFTLAESGQTDHHTLKDQGRIEYNLTLHELISSAARLLEENGRFFLVHRPDRLDEIIEEYHACRLHVRRMQMAIDIRDGQTKSVLIEAARRADLTILNRIIMEPPVMITGKGIHSWSAWKESINDGC